MLSSASFNTTNALGICGSCDLRWAWPGDNTSNDGHYISFNSQRMAFTAIGNHNQSVTAVLTGTCFIPFSGVVNQLFWNDNVRFDYRTLMYGYNGTSSTIYKLFESSICPTGSGSFICPDGAFTFYHSSVFYETAGLQIISGWMRMDVIYHR